MNLKQLVDLAFEKPASGTVNIKLLHTILHLLIEKLDFDNVPIEYKGKNVGKITEQIEKVKNEPSSRDFALESDNETGTTTKDKEVSYDLVNCLIESNAIAQTLYNEAIEKLDSRICSIECSSGNYLI